MRKIGILVISSALSACLPVLLSAQDRATQPEVPALGSAPRELSGLQITGARRPELEEALNRRDYKKAEAILLEEVERLLVIAAGIFFLDGQYMNSVIAWKKAETIAPLDDGSRLTLAMAYVKLNRRDWARPELAKLAAAQPENPLYLYWLARLDYDAQDYAAAIARLQKVIELNPAMTRAYDTLGLCYDYIGRFDEAIKSYNHAVELNQLQANPSPWPHVDLAISLMAVNQPAEAEKNLRQALDYDARLPQAHYQLGRVLEMQGDYQAAIQSLKQSIALDPAYPEPHYLLGRLYHRLGEEQLSKKEIAQFQQLKKASETQPTAKSSSSPK